MPAISQRIAVGKHWRKSRGLPKLIRPLPRGLMFSAAHTNQSMRAVYVSKSFTPIPIMTTVTTPPNALAMSPRGPGLRLQGNASTLGYALNEQPPTTWSMEALVYVDNPTSNGDLCGFNQNSDGSSTTQDRTISTNPGLLGAGKWGASLFDGATQVAGNTLISTSKGFYHFIATTDGVSFKFFVNELQSGTTTTVSNGGFTTYALPVYFCIGQVQGSAGPGTFASCVVLLVNFASVTWTQAEINERFLDPFGFLEWSTDRRVGLIPATATWGFENEFPFPVRRKVTPITQRALSDDPIWPFTATKTPTQYGWHVEPQFAERKKFQVFDPRLQHEDPNWPFTATITPTQYSFAWEPQFPVRRRPRLFRDADEEWKFTATVTPAQYGWHLEPQHPVRRRLPPLRDADEEWPFTAAITPAQYGWHLEPQHPTRRRARLFRDADEQYPFTATVTPAQYGWHLEPQHPVRRRARLFQDADEHWQFTATITPAQYGWVFDPQHPIRRRAQMRAFWEDVVWPITTPPTIIWGFDPDALFAIRRRPRPLTIADEQWPFTATVTDNEYGWHLEPQHPLRQRPRLFRDADEQWVFTATVTPAQFGWHLEPQHPIRRRPRLFKDAGEQWPFTATVTPTQYGWTAEPSFPQRYKIRLRRDENGDLIIVSTTPIVTTQVTFDTPFIVNLGRMMNRPH